MMNDFTKDELQDLLSWARSRIDEIGDFAFECEGGRMLYRKIKSMIDNPCSHQFLYPDNCSARCLDCDTIVEGSI